MSFAFIKTLSHQALKSLKKNVAQSIMMVKKAPVFGSTNLQFNIAIYNNIRTCSYLILSLAAMYEKAVSRTYAYLFLLLSPYRPRKKRKPRIKTKQINQESEARGRCRW